VAAVAIVAMAVFGCADGGEGMPKRRRHHRGGGAAGGGAGFGAGAGAVAAEAASPSASGGAICSDASADGEVSDASDDACSPGSTASPTSDAATVRTDSGTAVAVPACGPIGTGVPPTADQLNLLCGSVTGATATSFDLVFDWAYRNSADRASNLQLSYSTDGINYVAVSAANFTTPATKDASIASVFTDVHESVTLTGTVDAASTPEALIINATALHVSN
jgi:hypothetical protein